MKLKPMIWDLIAAGRDRRADIEILRRILILNALMLPGMLFTLVLGLLACYRGSYLLGGVDMVLFAVQIWLIMYTRRTDDLRTPVSFAMITFMAFLVFLTVNGGVAGTAVLWVLLYPSVSILLLGTRSGIRYSLVLLLLVHAVFLFQGSGFITGSYSTAFQIRLSAVYITIGLLAISAEEVRKRINLILKESNREKQEIIEELNRSLEEIRTLQEILPICLECRKIRDDSGYWQAVEEYLQERTRTTFTHALCPECAGKMYPEYSKRKTAGKAESME